MKETMAYRSEYLVVDCPYCGHKNYIDIADDYGEGNLPESGRKMTCEKCNKMMLVLPY